MTSAMTVVLVSVEMARVARTTPVTIPTLTADVVPGEDAAAVVVLDVLLHDRVRADLHGLTGEADEQTATSTR